MNALIIYVNRISIIKARNHTVYEKQFQRQQSYLYRQSNDICGVTSSKARHNTEQVFSSKVIVIGKCQGEYLRKELRVQSRTDSNTVVLTLFLI